MLDTVNSEAKALFADLDKPSLHALSYALRHPDTWPAGFVWNYKHCESCAMGLAHQLWNSIPETTPDTAPSYMARTFAMPYSVAKDVFVGSGEWMPHKPAPGFWKRLLNYEVCDFEAVTPEMVADQIDLYLAKAE